LNLLSKFSNSLNLNLIKPTSTNFQNNGEDQNFDTMMYINEAGNPSVYGGSWRITYIL